MKVALDGLLLFLNNGQVGQYSKSIADNLIKYSDIDLSIVKDYEITSNKYKNNSVELFLNRKDNNFSNLNKFLISNNIDIYHCLNNGFSIPNNLDFNYIISINNLLPIYYEHLCPINYNANFFSKLPYGVMNSSQIVCSSTSTKSDFLDNFAMDESKLSVNYGIVSRYYNKSDNFLSSVYVESKFNIYGDFVIFYGDFHERKNLEKSILLFKDLQKNFSKLSFVISSDSFNNKKYLDILIDLSKNIGVYNNIIYLSNLDTMDKVNLFNRALCFIDLSIYENVNLNIVEAFSCSTPIICSDIPLYREYFGESVFYYIEDFNALSILKYINSYSFQYSSFVLDKFSSDISLRCSLNAYNNFLN